MPAGSGIKVASTLYTRVRRPSAITKSNTGGSTGDVMLEVSDFFVLIRDDRFYQVTD